MQDVAVAVPVAQVLRHLRVAAPAIPELDGAALADERMAHRVDRTFRDGDDADTKQERYGEGEARDGEGRSWHRLEHGIAGNSEDREELHGIFKAIGRAVAAPAANPWFFKRNI